MLIISRALFSTLYQLLYFSEYLCADSFLIAVYSLGKENIVSLPSLIRFCPHDLIVSKRPHNIFTEYSIQQ